MPMLMPALSRFRRRFVKQRLFLFINIGGLALGLGCCLLVGLFVWYEASYDAQYVRAEDIYLAVESRQQSAGVTSLGEYSTPQLSTVLLAGLPRIEGVARYLASLATVHLGSEQFEADEGAVHYADPAFLRIFDFKWLEGTPESAFRTPDEIVLTRQLADKYFGTSSALGRSITINGDSEVRVSGVIDKPATTVLDFMALLPMELQARKARAAGQQALGFNVRTFVLLNSKNARADAEAALPVLLERQKDVLNAMNGDPLVTVELKPLRTIYGERHFQSNEEGLTNGARRKVFSAIGFCVLLIAVANYMTLSTSRYSTRALEVGVSLSLGSGRAVLARRFLAESLAFTALAMLFGLMLAEVMMPVLTAYVGVELAFSDVPFAILGPVLLLGTLLIGVLAGAYPAFYLSHAEPVRILRGELTRGGAGQRIREGLVVGQFAAAIALLVVAVVMYGQLRHLQTLDRGFEPERVLTLDLPGQPHFNLVGQWPGFAARLQQVPGVDVLTLGIDSPLRSYRIGAKAVAGEEEVEMSIIPVLPDYLPFYGIELLAGRGFLAESQADSARFGLSAAAAGQAPKGNFLISASAARMLGWTPEEALGQVLSVNSWGIGSGTVVGVVEDTISNTNQQSAPSLYLVPETLNFALYNGTVSLKLGSGELQSIEQGLRAVWNEYFPALPLSVAFLDDKIQALYRSEANQLQFFAVSALIAILIACLGLFGLASSHAEHRTKEIGVRKVLGGSVWSIVVLLTTDFSKLVLISNLIAWPLAWVIMSRWLEQFAYRIDLTPLVFIGSGLIALCIAWVTVGSTAAKAASQKPVLALRYE